MPQAKETGSRSKATGVSGLASTRRGGSHLPVVKDFAAAPIFFAVARQVAASFPRTISVEES